MLRLRFLVHLVGAGRVPDHTVSVDDEDGSSTSVASIVDHVIQTGHLEVLVAQVREIDPTEALREPAVRVDVVVADGNDLSICVPVLLMVRPKGG